METQVKNLIKTYSCSPARLQKELNKIGLRYSVTRNNVRLTYTIRDKNPRKVAVKHKIIV